MHLLSRVMSLNVLIKRAFSQISHIKSVLEKCPSYMQLCKEFESEDSSLAHSLINTMQVYQHFLSVDEEKSLFDEVESYLEKLPYVFDNWKYAIHGYREREKMKWNEQNTAILDRVRKIAFPPDDVVLNLVHMIDLHKNGYIKPHVDSVRYSGDTIAGLSLLTDSVMRLVHNKNKKLFAHILLRRRSLYVMKGTARYDYTHEILGNNNSKFNGVDIFKDRRISVMRRNHPHPHIKF